MFTGIVKEVGRIKEAIKAKGLLRLAVESHEVCKASDTGDSVSVNGACLTVAKKEKDTLYFDAVEETLRRTTLASIAVKDAVNLEGSLKVGGTIGGHFVTGHVDCVGRIKNIASAGADTAFEISMPDSFAALVAEKGSIAIDGVSLTVGEVKKGSFKVYLIPHTLKSTTLGMKKRADEVNIEFDIMARYAARQKESPAPRSNITEEFLRSKGF
jgi:riboflavin synthase